MTKYDEETNKVNPDEGIGELIMPTGKTVFTHDDRKLLVELHATVTELKALVVQAEPFLDSFLGGGGAPKSPMNAIFGALMGGSK